MISILCASLLLMGHQTLLATTFKVTNTNNSGPGSLREAIQFANNSSGADDIIFEIPGSAPHTIAVSGALPQISDPLIIDGSTQPANGFNGVSPKIIINGGGTQNISGLVIAANNSGLYGTYITGFRHHGLVVMADQCIIGSPNKGNVFNGNEYDQVEFMNVQGGIIRSNKIGTDTTGTISGTPAGIGYNGLSLTGSSAITIEGNLISGNNYSGISLICSKNNFIFSNTVGTDITGKVALPNKYYGINLIRDYQATYCTSDNNTIGDIGKGNLISGNEYSGINLQCAANNMIFNNNIGLDINESFHIPNGYYGICVEWDEFQNLSLCSGDNNVIGDLNRGNTIIGNEYGGVFVSCSSNNTISNNIIDANGYGLLPEGGDGVNIGGTIVFSGEPNCITENNLTGGYGNENIISNSAGFGVNIVGNYTLNNQVSQNSIYCNKGGINLIDFYNYVGNGNNSHPAPTIITASSNSVSGTATPNDTIEVFATSSACTECQGEYYFGSTVTDAAGNWVFSGNLSGTIVTTATSPSGNTSPFSSCSPLSTANESIDVPSEINWSVHPNPVESGKDITISIENFNEDFNDLKLEMYDLMGRIVQQVDITASDAIQLNTKDLSAGMYLISLKRDQTVIDFNKIVLR